MVYKRLALIFKRTYISSSSPWWNSGDTCKLNDQGADSHESARGKKLRAHLMSLCCWKNSCMLRWGREYLSSLLQGSTAHPEIWVWFGKYDPNRCLSYHQAVYLLATDAVHYSRRNTNRKHSSKKCRLWTGAWNVRSDHDHERSNNSERRTGIIPIQRNWLGIAFTLLHPPKLGWMMKVHWLVLDIYSSGRVNQRIKNK